MDAHPEEAALLASIRATPDADLPRLVLADWYEERGEVERAEANRELCRGMPAGRVGRIHDLMTGRATPE